MIGPDDPTLTALPDCDDEPENDSALRERLCSLIPEGAHYTAEEIGEASGAELDTLAIRLGTERRS